MVQIIVLAAVAFFLFWRLKSVLGSRQGFENPKQNRNNKSNPANQNSLWFQDTMREPEL